MPPKAEFEVTYFGGPDNPKPCGGLDYSRPYTALDKNHIAPGSVNLQNINGFLCSSPWLGTSPYATSFSSGEFVIGISPVYYSNFSIVPFSFALIITNLSVYVSTLTSPYPSGPPQNSGTLQKASLAKVFNWTTHISPVHNPMGTTVSFVEIAGDIYFCNPYLDGIYYMANGTTTVAQATAYVTGAYMIELAGRLVIAECSFPGGGGTGTTILPTVAWSGVGAYVGSGGSDPWDPVNQLGGGFNELSDIPDQISGMATVGTSAIVHGGNGVSQIDPNPGYSTSGIQPFIFYHLWNSMSGVGAYPNSVAQYGQTIVFRDDDNIYNLSLSGGLTPIGSRIISKINADFKTFGYLPAPLSAGTVYPPKWYFGSIVNIGGQLHYLLAFSGITAAPATTTRSSFAFIYDYNLNEDAWHIWDFSQYFTNAGASTNVLLISSPPTTIVDYMFANGYQTSAASTFGLPYLLFGTVFSLPPTSTFNPSGELRMLVPLDYNATTNFVTDWNHNLYACTAIPQSTIVTRGEVVSLGHKITVRRIRIQADNAPLQGPGVPGGAMQTASVALSGASSSAITNTPPSPGVVNTGVNIPFTENGVIQTYYGDLKLTDEMVQTTIKGVVTNAGSPWASLPAFRIASLSMIGNDAQGTTQ